MTKGEPKPAARATLAPPQGMPAKALTEFRHITAELKSMGVLHRADRAVIVAHCLAVDRMLTAMRKLRRPADYIGLTSQGENPSAWVKVQRDAIQDIRGCCSELGLSPVARTRIEVKPPSGTSDADSVEALRDEAAARDTGKQ